MSVQLLASTIQFLCVSIRDTLLHVTLKRRAEISYYELNKELKSKYFSASAKQSVNKSFIILKSHETKHV